MNSISQKVLGWGVGGVREVKKTLTSWSFKIEIIVK